MLGYIFDIDRNKNLLSQFFQFLPAKSIHDYFLIWNR